MNIEPSFRVPDHSDNWLGFEFTLRNRAELDADGDLYGCTGCGRKACRGCHERLFEPTRDEYGIPY